MVEFIDPLLSKRRLTHKEATSGDISTVKILTVTDYSAIVDSNDSISFDGNGYAFLNTVETPESEIEISVLNNGDQAQIIYDFLLARTAGNPKFIALTKTGNTVIVEASESFTFTTTSSGISIADGTSYLLTPEGDQLINLTKEAARQGATLLVNVYIQTSDEGNPDPLDGKCVINLWIYDGKLNKLCLGESSSYPGKDSLGNDLDNRHARPYKFDIAGQSSGLTISNLEGTNAKVWVTATVVARITGGN